MTSTVKVGHLKREAALIYKDKNKELIMKIRISILSVCIIATITVIDGEYRKRQKDLRLENLVLQSLRSSLSFCNSK